MQTNFNLGLTFIFFLILRIKKDKKLVKLRLIYINRTGRKSIFSL